MGCWKGWALWWGMSQFLEDGASCNLERDAEVLGHKLFKSPCFISSAADSLGDFSCPFPTCFRVWVCATCHVFLMLQSFVAGTQFCLAGKNPFFFFSFFGLPCCLTKAIHLAWGIRLLWGQGELIPPLCRSADHWGGMWNGRINRVHAKGNPINRSFLLQHAALFLSATSKEFTPVFVMPACRGYITTAVWASYSFSHATCVCSENNSSEVHFSIHCYLWFIWSY